MNENLSVVLALLGGSMTTIGVIMIAYYAGKVRAYNEAKQLFKDTRALLLKIKEEANKRA